MATSLVPGHGERFERPECDAWLIFQLFLYQMERWEPIDQGGESLLTLDAGQRRPETLMDPGSESYVRVRIPRDVEPVGLREPRGVAIGRRNEPPSPIEFAKDVAPQFDIFRGDALQRLDGRVVPQALLGGIHSQRGARLEQRPLLRMADQGQRPVADEIDRRLVPGEQEEHRVRDHLVAGQGAA